MWHNCGCRTRSDLREYKCAESEAKKMSHDLGTKPLSRAVIAKHCLTLVYMNINDEVIRMDDK